jgi:glutathione S-transferase
MEWLNFISTELHKGFGALFNPAFPEEARAIVRAQLERRLSETEQRLAGKPYVMGEDFSVADAYLFTVLGWGKYVGLDLAPWPGLIAYLGRVAERPAVAAALKAEGLV